MEDLNIKKLKNRFESVSKQNDLLIEELDKSFDALSPKKKKKPDSFEEKIKNSSPDRYLSK
jgi:hypothetical protein